MKFRYLLIMLLLGVVSCQQPSSHWSTIQDVNNYIEVAPDSALTVLSSINSEDLNTEEEKATYALLLTMALDKNWIDKTDFEILQPAIDYFAKYGTPTEKLKTLYYQGRIFQNNQKTSLAMECYLNALNQGAESDDFLTKARIFFAQGNIYQDLYEWDKLIEVSLLAADYFNKAGLVNSRVNSLNKVINGYILKKDTINVEKYILLCRNLVDSVNVSLQSDIYANYLIYANNHKSKNDVLRIINDYITKIPHSNVDWIAVSDAYNKIGDINKAYNVIQKYNESIYKDTDNARYNLALSLIYKELEMYNEAFETYRLFTQITDSVTLSIFENDTQFIEERFQLELQAMGERNAKNRTIYVSIIVGILLLGIIIWIRVRLKINIMQKDLLAQEKERYKLLYQQMETERDNLSELLSKNDKLDVNTKNVVIKRLELLNKFFMLYITDNSEVDRKLTEEMEELIANKETFMESTRLAFTGSHPKFIMYLEEKGLTEWEIKYCCLYALGLRGKEVGAYIKMRGHYNNSSIIREKLGITEHDTNLSIYIRKLLERFS